MIINETNNKIQFEELFGSKARVKIIKILAINEELNISLIIRKTRLNYKIVSKHLNLLKSLNIVEEKRFGRIKIFRYKIENFKALILKRFIETWEETY